MTGNVRMGVGIRDFKIPRNRDWDRDPAGH
jgi:hypothetical protein